MATLRAAGVLGHVEVVHDGAEALDHLSPQVPSDPHRDELPSFVVVDLDVSVGHVGRLLRKIRGSPRMNALPLVVLASSVRSPGLAESLDEGASIGLLKPLTPLSLAYALRSIGPRPAPVRADRRGVIHARPLLTAGSRRVQ